MADAFFKDGTWDVMFEAPLKAAADDRVGLAIVSIKHELVYNGVPRGGMNLDVPEIGAGTTKAIQAFQRAHGLVADGSVGPLTAVVLWRRRANAEGKRVGMPTMLLPKQKSLESADDPACTSAKEGADPKKRDRGLAQINEFYHGAAMPDAKAFTASLSLPWMANYMLELYKLMGDWTLALAAYNVGTSAARKWDAAGRPRFNADGSRNTASQYVEVVLSRTG